MKKKNYPAYIYHGEHTAKECEEEYEQRRWELLLLVTPINLQNIAVLAATAFNKGCATSAEPSDVAAGVNNVVNLILQQYYEEV